MYVDNEVKSLSRVRPFATPWTVAHQAPPPMGFSMQEYWGGLPFLSPGDLPDPGIEPTIGIAIHRESRFKLPGTDGNEEWKKLTVCGFGAGDENALELHSGGSRTTV